MFNQRILSSRNVWWFLAIGVLLTVIFNFFVIFASYKSTQRSEDERRKLELQVTELKTELDTNKKALLDSRENASKLKSRNADLTRELEKEHANQNSNTNTNTNTNVNYNKNTNTNTNTKSSSVALALGGAIDFRNPLNRAQHMHAHVQKLIYDSQHPQTCDKSKLIRCELNAVRQ